MAADQAIRFLPRSTKPAAVPTGENLSLRALYPVSSRLRWAESSARDAAMAAESCSLLRMSERFTIVFGVIEHLDKQLDKHVAEESLAIYYEHGQHDKEEGQHDKRPPW